MKRTGGTRRKTRSKLRKPLRRKGKISISRYFQKLEPGQRVDLIAEPAIQRGMFSRRFIGKSGTVTGMQGRCYEVEVMEGSKAKVLIVHPVHLRRAK